MKTNTMQNTIQTAALLLMGITAIGGQLARAAEAELTAGGKQLEAEYSAMLEKTKAAITGALPQVDESKKAAYLDAIAAEKAANKAVGVASRPFGELKTAEALVGHAEWKWVGGAEKDIAKAKAQLKEAKTDAEREKAQSALAAAEKDLANGQKALKERTAKRDQLKAQEPAMQQALAKAKQAHQQARDAIIAAVDAMGLDPLLQSDQLDHALAKFVVLHDATSQGLAAYAQQGSKEKARVDQLLADGDLMVRMVLADGAKRELLPSRKRVYGPAHYGRAIEIYTAIQQASAKAKQGPLERLALAISLEHAVPLEQSNPKAATDAPQFVDPVQRYLHYEKAFLDGELDPGFADLTVWEYRMVVDGEEPDEILAWGREMLRTYRPDHIRTGYAWRYVAIVRTDVQYGSGENKYDQPNLQFYQNILMNGGVCGRRAFIGRFILRAFGIPTVPRPQRGHAALAHWTPDGWVICFGTNWGGGYAPWKYNSDLNFLAESQGRATGEPYLQVKRAQWIGDVLGEKRALGLVGTEPGFWNGIALYRQHKIIREAKSVALAAVGEELGEANESDVDYAIESAKVSGVDKEIRVDAKGVIAIPAVACTTPAKSTSKIIFMDSFREGKQLHYSRTGQDEDFEYAIEAPASGKYALTAKVASPSWKQHFHVIANQSKPVNLALPHTLGLWDTTDPVTVELTKGPNTLRFTRQGVPHEVWVKGITFKEFELTPMK